MSETPMWRRYLRFLGPVPGADLDDELRFHLEELTEDLMAKGMDPERARAEAERRLGDVAGVRDEVRAIERGGARRERLAGLARDVRHAARGLRRSPGFTIVAVLTLALGIGANTAIFSVVNSVLFRPLPVEGLGSLVVVREDLPGIDLRDAQLAPAEVMDLRQLDDVFAGVVGLSGGDRTLTGRGDAARVSTTQTLGDFGAVFGARPLLGRFYSPEASTDGEHRVAVVSEGLWRQLSGGSPSFIGETIELNGVDHEVVGVMPGDFRYPREAQVWVPFDYDERWTDPQRRGSLMMTAVGRVREGVGPELLAARMEAEANRWNADYHAATDFGKTLHSVRFVEYLAGPLRLILLVLTGAVVFVLMIAAANVASLQLVRAAGRSREIAVRAAIGAGRGRIVRQLLVESLMLSFVGALLGLGIGAAALALLERWGPAVELGLADLPLDGPVLAFTAGVALLAAVAFGILPALRASRLSPQETLRGASRGASAGPGRSRLLRASVVVQIALALVLLLGSGLMIRTLSRLLAADPGFAPEALTTAQVSIAGTAYDTPQRRLAFFDALLERARALPGVQDAALVTGLPFAGGNDSSPFDIPGRPRRPGEPERHHEATIVSDGYLRTMRIPLLSGRDFDGTERPGNPPVALIDQTFAEQFFPGEDPVGQRIRGYTGDLTTIIGVVGRIDHDEVGDAPKAVAYYSAAQMPWYGSHAVALRSDLPVGSVTSMLRAAVAELDPNVPLYDVQTMEGRIERSLGPQRLAMLSLGAFAALSLLLATLGVYGVMRYSTNQRVREIGIRMAVGARPRDVVRLVVRQGMAIASLGLAIGVVAALGLTGFMTGVLFGVGPHDPVSFLAATATLAIVALAASWLPARRATRVDPVEALRTE